MEGFVDLVDLDDIGEQSVLHAIEKRFQKNEIYSSLGTILIAMNPYRHIPDIYSTTLLEEMMKIDPRIDPNLIFRFERPHVWMIARNAYLQLKGMRISQAIVISGESGAGKTETTKKCLQYLSSLAAKLQHHDASPHRSNKPPPHTSSSGVLGEEKIEDKILATNPVLESFGNAKTARNNNSSRFGKWIQINYQYGDVSAFPEMMGGEITQYLLEKSRVVVHAPDERNYHIFYQICASGIQDLQPAASYRYLRYSKNMKIPGVDDKTEFQATCDSMVQLGFTEPDRETIFATLKGILLLGNIIFSEDLKSGMSTISEDYHPLIQSIAKLFGWNADTLPQRFVSRSITVRGEQSTIQLNAVQSQDAVNAFAKEIYSRVFNYIVFQANSSLQSPLSSSGVGKEGGSGSGATTVSIGLLDIFGFEKFKSNSFEQLCINYANEKLQQYFINYVLKKEQDLYRAEGVDSSEFMVAIIDNADVLQLFEGRKNGIFTRLDDEIKLPKASDETFLKKLETDHNNQKDSSRRFFKDVKMPLTQFEIRHFAGVIRYDCLGFLEKNRDKLNDNLEELFSLSTNVLFRRIMLDFAAPNESSGASSGSNSQKGRMKDVGGGDSAFSPVMSASGTTASTSIATRFQSQLQQLVDVLNASQPHFIKCVKPNNLKQEAVFEKELVLAQLKYSGVLEAIQIRRSGYPVRRNHDLFWRSYWMLAKGLQRLALHQMSDLEKCQSIIQRLASNYPKQNYSEEMKAGKSLIFCKSKTLQSLEALKQQKLIFITVKLQCYCRRKAAVEIVAKKRVVKKQILNSLDVLTNAEHRNDITLINPTQLLLKAGEENDLPRPLLLKLRQACNHLIEIQRCYEKLEYHAQLLASGPQQQSSDQILKEFLELQSLLTLARENNLRSPHIPEVERRLESLRERAEMVEKLLALLEEGDDLKIIKHLSRIEESSVMYGKFCEEEIARGKAVLKLIQIDKKTMGEIFDYLQKYLEMIQSLSPDGSTSTSSQRQIRPQAVDGHLVATRLEECNAWLTSHSSLWKERGLAYKSFATSQSLLQELISFHALYLEQKWSELVQKLQSLRQLVATSVAALLYSLSTAREEERGALLLFRARYELFERIIMLESSLMSQDLQLNYLTPKLADLLSVDRIPFHAIHSPLKSEWERKKGSGAGSLSLTGDAWDLVISALEENDQHLLEFSEELNSFVDVFISREVCVSVVNILQRLIDARQSFADERWEQVILQSETMEEKIFRLQTLNEWYYEMKLALSALKHGINLDEAFFHDANTSMENVQSFYRPFEEGGSQDRSFSNYSIVYQRCRSHLHLLFSMALERLLQVKIRGVFQAVLSGVQAVQFSPSEFSFETSLLEKCSDALKKIFEHFGRSTKEPREARPTSRRLASSPLPSIRNPLESMESPKKSEPLRVSSGMNVILEGLEAICTLRKASAKQSWNLIIGQWEAKQLDNLLYEAQLEGLTAVTNENIQLIRDELLALTVYACNQYFRAAMIKQISEGSVQFSEVISSTTFNNTQDSTTTTVTSFSAADGSDVQHNEAWEICQRRITLLKAMSSEYFPPELEEVVLFIEELLRSRHFLVKQHDLTICEQSLESLTSLFHQIKSIDFLSSLPDLLLRTEKELEEMKLVIEGRKCMSAIWSALEDNDVPSQQFLLPFVPNQNSAGVSSSRARTASTSNVTSSMSSPAPARLKSLSFDLGLSSPLIGSQVSSTQIEDVLKSDGFMLNEVALETESLEISCVKVKEFKESLEMADRESPAEFLRWARAAEGVKYIRECILKGEWIIAQRIVQELDHLEVLPKFPKMQQEVSRNRDWINNYAVITCCLNALSKAPPNNTGLIGQPEYFKNVSTELLEEAVKLCQAIGRPSKRAEVLFNAVLTILDLRRAQKLGDWTEIRAVLTRAYAENIGAGMSDICFAEINRAIIERDNYDGIQGLKAAIINEEMLTKDSLLDVNQVSAKELSAALNKVASMPEDTRGMVLKALYGLADTISKARKAVQQKNWYVLENILPVLRENSESLQNELDSNQKGNVQRKTMFRTSSFHRGTILNSKDKRMTSADLAAVNNSFRSSLWEEFTEVSQSIKREIKAIEHHFAVMELDKQLNEVLLSGNITCDESTGQIIKSSIDVEELRECVDQATNLDLSTLSLPKHLKLLRKVGLLIIDIRQGVLNDKWETMSSLLEETLDNDYATMPDSCRQEIQAVRREVENRWILTNLSNALITGKLSGTVNDVNLREVTYNHLSSYISTARSLHPFTDEAFKLIASAEKIAKLREIIVDPLVVTAASDASPEKEKKPQINWNQVKKYSKELIDEVERPNSKLHKIILPECKLCLDVAEDRLTRDSMEQALTNGGPSGEPGRIVVTTMSTHQLEKAYQQAVRSSLKTDRAKQLLNICRSVQRLREALLRAESANTHREVEVEAWKTIRSLLNEIDEAKKQQQNPYIGEVIGWEICNQELDLIQKHAHVQDLKNGLIESAVRASHVYSERHQLNLHIELTKYDTAHSLELKQLCIDLDSIIQQALNLSFSSDYLQKYIACATTLRLYRSAILDGNWAQLEILMRDHSFQSNLNVLPETKQELSWILCELHNNQAIQILRSALEIHLSSNSSNSAVPTKEASEAEIDIYTREWDLKMLHGQSFAKRNEQLKQAIHNSKQYKITSKVALQWLECAENMFLLRSSLELRDNAKVVQALRWFKANAILCPDYIRLEAQRAYVIYQNDLLLHGLTFALNHGKPSGKCGAINVQIIETQAIEDLLKQANDINPKIAEVEALIQAARISLVIRNALKTRNMAALKDIIADLSSNHDDEGTGFSLLIVDEIATAKGELDNEISIQALTKALKSFEDSESKSLDLTFSRANASSPVYNSQGEIANSLSFSVDQQVSDDTADQMIQSINTVDSAASIDLVEFPSPNPRRFHSSILESFSPIERRYSFANKNSANIDLETIDIEILDYGLRVAKDHGIYSDRAKRLHNTVELIKALRLALKNSDWFLLEDILTKSQYEENLGAMYDELAGKEIQTLRSQLLMRTAIVDLSKALKTGWAQCSHGIVDTSNMKNDLLLTAIEKADHCMVELSQATGAPIVASQPVSTFTALNMTSYIALEMNEEEGGKQDQLNTTTSTPSTKRGRDKGKESKEGGSGRRKSVQFADDVAESSTGSSNKKQPSTPTATSLLASFNLSTASPTMSGQRSTIEEQIKLLIHSAKLIFHIRDILSTGNIEMAGQLAEEALSKQLLHYSVIEELKLYAKEINTALLSLKLIETCKQSMGSGKLQPLEKALNMIFEKEIHFSSDLGIIYIIVKAEERYRQLCSMKKRLLEAKSCFELDEISRVIQQAKRINYCDIELEELLHYYQTLIYFQNKVYFLFVRWVFQNESLTLLQEIAQIARDLKFTNHPLTQQIHFLLQCNPTLLATIKIMKCLTLLVPKNRDLHDRLFRSRVSGLQSPSSIISGDSAGEDEKNDREEQLQAMKSFALSFSIHGFVTQSLQHKRVYLQLPSSQQKYRLENFSNLRPVNDFSFRMNVISEDLKRSFLSYSEQSLPCSLTRLPPQLSSVAVYIYSQMIRGVERSLFTYPEVVVKQLVTIGSSVTLLRDEILLQIVKQIRHHPMPEKRKRSANSAPPTTSSSGFSSAPSFAHIVSKVQQQQQLQELLQSNRLIEDDNLDDEDNLLRFIEKQEQARTSVLSLWRLLMMCLFYFPPSADFENFLELFLWEEYDEHSKSLRSFCQRYQHAHHASSNASTASTASDAEQAARKLERKPSSMTNTASEEGSGSTGTGRDITNELEFYLHKNIRSYTMRCLRYLHRSILVYGYNHAIPPMQPPTSQPSQGVSSRASHCSYSLFRRDEVRFPEIMRWMSEAKDPVTAAMGLSVTLNASTIYYPPLTSATSKNTPANSSLTNTTPGSNYLSGAESSFKLVKKSRNVIQLAKFDSIIDPSLPHFLLSDEFNDHHLPLSAQRSLYLPPLTQLSERSESLIRDQFTKALLLDNLFLATLRQGAQSRRGAARESKDSGDAHVIPLHQQRFSFSSETMALTMRMIQAMGDVDSAEKVDGDCHLLLLAATTSDIISGDPAFPRISFPKEDPVFDDQVIAYLQKAAVTSSSTTALTSSQPLSKPSGNIRLRGTREDWIARFRSLQITGRDAATSSSSTAAVRSAFIQRNQFCHALAATIIASTKANSPIDVMDRMDRDVFYFLLFGKKLSNSNRSSIVREFRYDAQSFHYLSADELASSQLRRQWLDDHVSIPNSMSELMLSQLQSSDLLYAAERFWDSVIVKMSKECAQFPFLRFDDDDDVIPSTETTDTSSTPLPRKRTSRILAFKESSETAGDGVSFNWEIYREIVLTATKKYMHSLH